MCSAVRGWRDRAALSVSEVAELLGRNPRAIRKHFRIVQVAGRQMVRTDDLRKALGEDVPAPRVHETAPRTRDPVVDSIVKKMLG